MSILEAFAADNYRIPTDAGDIQALGYLRTNPLFYDGYLGMLYQKMRGDRYSHRRPNGTGVIESLFFGMDPSWDSIVAYLSKLPLIVIGVWEDGVFHPGALIFRTISLAQGNSCMMGYTVFREYWGTKAAEVFGMMGLAFAFQEFNLKAIHGMRYADNLLTKNFLKPYGFKDTGVHPRWEVRRGELVDTVTSCCLREDFENYLEQVLLSTFAIQKKP